MKTWLKQIGSAAVLALVCALWVAAGQSTGASEPDGGAASSPEYASSLEDLRAKQVALQRKLVQQVPAEVYIVVDTARNRLYIKRRDEVLLEAVASTGSGTILDDPGRPGARWVFDTPRGEFTIKSRITNPMWVKPDWAFVEEGLEVPKDPGQRVEAGTLGDYALGFGKGYFIHGTLYTRLLGKNVTHGCIRLNDDDLRTVFKLAKIGTPILIF